MALNLSRPADIERDDRYGRLVVLRKVKRNRTSAGKPIGSHRYQCGCVCQRIVVVAGSKLRQGQATSCGRCGE